VRFHTLTQLIIIIIIIITIIITIIIIIIIIIICLEVFTATELNKSFSSRQPRQKFTKSDVSETNCISVIRVMEMEFVSETSDFINLLARLYAQGNCTKLLLVPSLRDVAPLRWVGVSQRFELTSWLHPFEG
jgi:hypothetical protein